MSKCLIFFSLIFSFSFPFTPPRGVASSTSGEVGGRTENENSIKQTFLSDFYFQKHNHQREERDCVNGSRIYGKSMKRKGFPQYQKNTPRGEQNASSLRALAPEIKLFFRLFVFANIKYCLRIFKTTF